MWKIIDKIIFENIIEKNLCISSENRYKKKLWNKTLKDINMFCNKNIFVKVIDKRVFENIIEKKFMYFQWKWIKKIMKDNIERHKYVLQ